MIKNVRTIISDFKKHLDEKNISSFSTSDWYSLFSNELSNTFITTMYKINPKWLFRARPNFDSNGNAVDFFKNTKELWAPPYKKVKKQGRCNKVHQSLLYCSSNPTTTLFETKPNTNDELTIVEYMVKNNIFPLGAIGVQDIVNVGDDFKKIFSNHFNNTSDESLVLDRILSAVFKTNSDNTKDYPIYNLTNAITQIFLNKQIAKDLPKHLISPKLIGLIYPSVETYLPLGVNIVMDPREVKNILVPKNAYKFKIIERISHHHYVYVQTFETNKIYPNGEMKWSPSNGKQKEYITDLPVVGHNAP